MVGFRDVGLVQGALHGVLEQPLIHPTIPRSQSRVQDLVVDVEGVDDGHGLGSKRGQERAEVILQGRDLGRGQGAAPQKIALVKCNMIREV